MAKDPAFLFYPNDWLGGTLGMTFEEKGAYMELLMLQFNRGHMTTHMIGQTVGQLWVNLEDKFCKDKEGKFYNKRLQEEQIKRKNYTNSRRNNIKGENQYTKSKNKSGHTSKHMVPHMEDENENRNVNRKLRVTIPELKEFMDHAEVCCKAAKLNFKELEFSIKSKYESWIENDWKDGFDNHIKSWRTKFKTTLTSLKPIKSKNNQAQGPKHKFFDPSEYS